MFYSRDFIKPCCCGQPLCICPIRTFGGNRGGPWIVMDLWMVGRNIYYTQLQFCLAPGLEKPPQNVSNLLMTTKLEETFFPSVTTRYSSHLQPPLGGAHCIQMYTAPIEFSTSCINPYAVSCRQNLIIYQVRTQRPL